MFEYMSGVLTAIHPQYIVLDVHGIGFQLFVANPYRFSADLEQSIKVYVYQAIREDAMTLYGFKTEFEKEIYLKLISVSGIGPKSGLSILANEDYEGLVQAIESANVAYLVKFPGIGKKTASQIVLDLKGKLSRFVSEVVQPVANETLFPSYVEEAKEALLALGYTQKDIQRITPHLEEQEQSFTGTEDALRVAFKLLLKK